MNYEPLKDINKEDWVLRAVEQILVSNNNNLCASLGPLISKIYNEYGPKNFQNRYLISLFLGEVFDIFNIILKRKVFGTFDYEISGSKILIDLRSEDGFLIDQISIDLEKDKYGNQISSFK